MDDFLRNIRVAQDNENGDFATERQYTQIVDAKPDLKTVKILKNLAFGFDGELTAITSYLFQEFVVENNEELKNELEHIAVQEMRHYELLSKAIVAFGGSPTLISGNGQVWTGRFTNTIKDPKIFLKQNIKGESDADLTYEKAATKVSNESLKKLLLEIAEDELKHEQIFQQQLDKLNI